MAAISSGPHATMLCTCCSDAMVLVNAECSLVFQCALAAFFFLRSHSPWTWPTLTHTPYTGHALLPCLHMFMSVSILLPGWAGMAPPPLCPLHLLLSLAHNRSTNEWKEYPPDYWVIQSQGLLEWKKMWSCPHLSPPEKFVMMRTQHLTNLFFEISKYF